MYLLCGIVIRSRSCFLTARAADTITPLPPPPSPTPTSTITCCIILTLLCLLSLNCKKCDVCTIPYCHQIKELFPDGTGSWYNPMNLNDHAVGGVVIFRPKNGSNVLTADCLAEIRNFSEVRAGPVLVLVDAEIVAEEMGLVMQFVVVGY